MPLYQELFGFSPQEEDIEDDLELLAAPKDVKITDPKVMFHRIYRMSRTWAHISL